MDGPHLLSFIWWRCASSQTRNYGIDSLNFKRHDQGNLKNLAAALLLEMSFVNHCRWKVRWVNWLYALKTQVQKYQTLPACSFTNYLERVSSLLQHPACLFVYDRFLCCPLSLCPQYALWTVVLNLFRKCHLQYNTRSFKSTGFNEGVDWCGFPLNIYFSFLLHKTGTLLCCYNKNVEFVT